MPGMDGFKLLEFINEEMKETNLPVVSKYIYIYMYMYNLYSRTKHFLWLCTCHIYVPLSSHFILKISLSVMSSDDNDHVILKAIVDGACDYLVKPIQRNVLKHIWQHVVRKRSKELKEMEQLFVKHDANQKQLVNYDNQVDRNTFPTNVGVRRGYKRNKVLDEGEAADNSTRAKRKTRLVWTQKLRELFDAAVDKLNKLGTKGMNPLTPHAFITFLFFIQWLIKWWWKWNTLYWWRVHSEFLMQIVSIILLNMWKQNESSEVISKQFQCLAFF